jgi:hypothetical protein
VQFTKLKFSEQESAALAEKDFFLVKNSATKKIIALFGEIEKTLKADFPGFDIDFPGLNSSAGKIFRGENYLLFPYVMLDYPRLFSTSSVFAFRTMFWWGHEFSFTLHLQGEAFDTYSRSIIENMDQLKERDIYYCVNNTPWQYTFDDENYRPVEEATGDEVYLTKKFIKLSRKISVERHDDVAEYCRETFRLFMGLLRSR